MKANIKKWIKENNLRKIEYENLLKIKQIIDNKNDNDFEKVLLDYPSRIRPLKERGFIIPHQKEIRKTKNYYDLTIKGYNIINKLKNFEYDT